MSEIIYENEICSIRSIQEKDTEKVVKWRNSVKEYFIDRKDVTCESHLAWYKSMICTGNTDQFIIANKAGIGLGSVFLKNIDNVSNKAEYGIFIGAQPDSGKGYGSNATRLILKHAFEYLHLNKVYLRVIASNKKAITMYKKIGFHEEGFFHQEVYVDGEYIDIVFMAIFHDAYNKNK